MVEVVFPWPNKVLFPNNKAHWGTKHSARKKQRADATWITLSHAITVPEGNIALHFIFHPPTKRHFDADNCLAACKGLCDGLADGLQIDDKRFRPITIEFGPIVRHGSVIVKI